MNIIRRRLGCLLLAAAMLLSTIPAAFAAPTPGMDNFKRVRTYTAGTFSDVSEGVWYTDSIKAAYEFGLAEGSAGKFDRKSNMTVQEAATLAARLHAIYNTGSTDVLKPSTPWYQVYLDYALANGIINQSQVTNRKAYATRAECAAMLAKAIPTKELTSINTVEDGAIPDVPASFPYYNDIYTLYRAGILTGNDAEGTFTPDAPIDRVSMITIATRIVDKTLRQKVTLTVPKSPAITMQKGSYNLASGTVTATVATVDLSNPNVRIEARHVDDTLNHTAAFSDIVAESSAELIVNANFFNANNVVKDVIGILMHDGEFMYCGAVLPTIGFTDDNRVFWGSPSIFVNAKSSDGKIWAAYSVNTLAQSNSVSVLYTPARGETVPITCDGYVMTVIDDVIRSYEAVSAGTEQPIPANGYIIYMGPGFTSTAWFRTPVVGCSVTLDPFLFKADSEGFELTGVTEIVSGAPRLVQDGEMCYELISGFQEERFTTAVTPRTAIGTTKDGKLIVVNVLAASIQQMRELMLELGCEDATNLDGGGSAALYYQGQILCSPGRKLTSTLQIFVD